MISNNARPTISVLMPAYNVAKYVEESVASILAQTFDDFELIVVDDGSTDKTLQILRRMETEDPRLRVMTTAKNSGLAAALNYGLESCRGSYIARADADDISLPNRFEKQIHFMEIRTDVSLSGCVVEKVNEAGEYIAPGPPVPLTQRAIQNSFGWGGCWCLHPTWFARRELFEKLGGYRAVRSEDTDLILRAATAGVTFGNLPDVLVRYRVRSGNWADLSGLELFKSSRYVLKLYRERLKYGSDSFSPAAYQRAVRVSSLEQAFYRPSQWLAKRAYRKPGIVRRYFYYALAAATSPYYVMGYWRAVGARFARISDLS